MRIKKSHCKRGHKYTKSIERWRWSRGYRVRGCKICEAMLARLKYRNEKLKWRVNPEPKPKPPMLYHEI